MAKTAGQKKTASSSANRPTVGKSSQRLSGWDFATWRSSTDQQMLRSAMMAVYVLDRAPDWDRLVDRYDRASRLMPILRSKIIEGPVAIANPRLVVDPDFDVSFHMRRSVLPKGSTWDDVLDEARRQSMTDFDLDRALWQITILEGLPGGRAVQIFKLHHAIADGQGALELGATLVDRDEKGQDLGPMPLEPEASELSSTDFAQTMIRDNAAWMATNAKKLAKGAGPAVVSAVKSPKETVGNIVETAQSIVRYSKVASGPASSIMQRRSANYHFGAFELPFENIRSRGKQTGNTANDVFLTSIAAGMEIYHRKHKAQVKALHIGMPISTRDSAYEGGNSVGIAHFDLPLNQPDVNKLMNQLHKVVDQWRSEPVIGFSNQLGEASRFIPSGMVVSAAQSIDLTASNIPGPPAALWLAGAKIEHIVPLPPLIGAAVFVALMTYDKKACVGIAMDDAAVTDQVGLIDAIAQGFAQVTGKPVERDCFAPSTSRPKAPSATAKKKPAPAK